jgi:hypothetical protein
MQEPMQKTPFEECQGHPRDFRNVTHQNNFLDFSQEFYITYKIGYHARCCMYQISSRTPSSPSRPSYKLLDVSNDHLSLIG